MIFKKCKEAKEIAKTLLMVKELKARENYKVKLLRLMMLLTASAANTILLLKSNTSKRLLCIQCQL